MSLSVNNFKDELLLLKTEMENNLNLLELREAKIDKLISSNESKTLPNLITLNIGGSIFKTKIDNILKFKSSLFYYSLMKVNDINKGLYFERSSKYFELILNFMKHNQVDTSNLSPSEMKELLEEVKYYYVYSLEHYLVDYHLYPEFISLTLSDPYIYNNNLVGSIDVDSIKQKNSDGIALSTNAWLILELNKPIEIKGIKVVGFINSSYFSSSYGSNTSVSSSFDNVNWSYLGFLGQIGNDETLFKPNEIRIAKYLKFENKSYMGFSYIKVEY